MKQQLFSKKTLAKSLILLGKIIGLILLAVLPALLVFTYLDVQKEKEKAFLLEEIGKLEGRIQQLEITPSPQPVTPTPTQIPKATSSIWLFKNNQYEVAITNVSYSQFHEKMFQAEFDFILRNLSITPFVISAGLIECEVIKSGILTSFIAEGSINLDKGLLPNETAQKRGKVIISGTYYDQSGNRIQPSSDLRIKSCKLYLSTPNKPRAVEPKTIQFPN